MLRVLRRKQPKQVRKEELCELVYADDLGIRRKTESAAIKW